MATNLSAKTVTGSRCIFQITDPATNNATPLGVFDTVSWGLTYSTQVIHILGRHAPAEIVYTAQEAVSITCTGYRTFETGPHTTLGGAVPELKDLLTNQYASLQIVDRQNPDKVMASFENLRATGYSTSVNAKNVEQVTVNYIGIYVGTEDHENNIEPGATSLP